MRRHRLLLMLPVMMLWQNGCSIDRGLVTGLTFERGSGSVWGNQLYIRMTQTGIATLRYIPNGSGELVERKDLSMTREQWKAILEQLEQLRLEREKPNLIGKLFGKKDGSDFRRLKVTCGSETVTYRWPENGQALETLLEQLVKEVAG